MTPSDVQIVADNLDDFIEVPDGIKRLRKAVLTLAVSGKLVPQDSKEGTAEDLYKKIQAEGARARENGERRKKETDIGSITERDIPFDIPTSWKWARFGETFFSVRGITFPGGDKSKEVEEGYIPILRSGNVQDTLNFNDLLYVPEKHVRNPNQYLKEGDIVVSMANSRELVGKSCLVEGFKGRYSFGGFLSVFRPRLISPAYFQIVFSSDFARARFFKDAKQVTNIANLSLATINLIPFPLPPLAEQKRIVAKVEEVMKQLDDLETKKRERDEVRTRLAKSAMQSLGKGDSKIAFEQLAELIKTQADLKELEGALLTLAVSGKLVPQDAKEGTAEDLHKKIQDERAKQESEGRKKKQNDTVPIAPDEVPFDIPKSWKWARVSELAMLITDGEHISPMKHMSGIPLVTAKNVLDSGVTFDGVDYVTKEDAKKFWGRCLPLKGDLLICSRGTIGRTSIVDIDAPFCLMGSVILIKFIDSTLSDFCKYYLRTQSGVAQIGLLRKGMAVGALYLKDIEKALIPLPPLAEQRRIIKKIEEVMSLVDHLREVLGETKTKGKGGRGRPKK